MQLQIDGQSFTVEQVEAALRNETSAQNDRETFETITEMIEAALPDFKGPPAPDDWTREALRELIDQRKMLLRALFESQTAINWFHAREGAPLLKSSVASILQRCKSTKAKQ